MPRINTHCFLLSHFSPEELLLIEETLEMRGGGPEPDLVGLKHRPILTPGSDASHISNTRLETAYE